MMRALKYCAIAATCLVASSVLAAYSSVAATDEQIGPSQYAGDSAGRTLTIWVPALMSEEARSFPEQFETADETVDVVVVTIPNPFEQNTLAKWAAGERPDILYFHGIGNWLVQLNPAENLVDLSDMKFVSTTLDGLLENSTEFNGSIYGALLDFPAIDGVMYNRDVFEDLELQAPDDFDGLLDVCAQIRDANPDLIPIDMAGGDRWPLQVLTFMLFNDALKEDPGIIDRLNSNEASFTDPEFVAGYEGLRRAMDAGCFGDDIATSTFEQTQERLMSGEAVMTVNLTHALIPALTGTYGGDEVSETIGFFPVSLESDVASWQTTGQAMYIPDGPQVDLAKDFLNWATGPAYQDYLDAVKQFPVLEGFVEPDGIATPLVEARTVFLANSVPQYQQNLQATYGDFAGYLSSMLFEGQSPEWVGDQMQSNFERSAVSIGLTGF